MAKQEVQKDDIQFSSEESGSEAVMRRFLGESKMQLTVKTSRKLESTVV